MIRSRLSPILCLAASLLLLAGCKGIPSNRSGVHQYEEGNFRRALNDFKGAIDANTNYRYARNNRGATNVVLGNYSNALEDFRVAIAARKTYAHARNNRGALYLDRGDDERALRELDLAVELRDEYIEAHFNRARLFLSTGDLDRALEDMDEAIRILTDDGDREDREWPAGYYFRGMLHQQLGNLELARLDFKEAVEQDEEMDDIVEQPYLRKLKPGILGE